MKLCPLVVDTQREGEERNYRVVGPIVYRTNWIALVIVECNNKNLQMKRMKGRSQTHRNMFQDIVKSIAQVNNTLVRGP